MVDKKCKKNSLKISKSMCKSQSTPIKVESIKLKLNLFKILRNLYPNQDNLCKKWMKQHKKYGNGLYIIIQLILDCSNCKYKITNKIFNIEMIEKYITDEPYLLCMKNKESKLFKYNVKIFMENLLNKYGNEILFELNIIHQLMEWLSNFSQSKYRGFRHICVILSGIIFKYICKIHNDLTNVISIKPKSKKRKSKINKSFDNIESNEKLCEKIFDEYFNIIFGNRYRDIVTDIRAISLEYIGEFIQINPNYFLKNDFLKYLGWMLNDRVGSIRTITLNCIYSIICNCDLKKLNHFISRFKTRIIDMCLDINEEVSIIAMKICHNLISKAIILDKKKLLNVYLLIYCESTKLSRNCALLLYDHFTLKTNNEKDIIMNLINFHLKNMQNEQNISRMIQSFFYQFDLFSLKKFLPLLKNILDTEDDQNIQYIIFQLIYHYLDHFFKSKYKNNENMSFVSEFINLSILKWLSMYRLEDKILLLIINICQFIHNFDDVILINQFLQSLDDIFTISNSKEILDCISSLFEKYSTRNNEIILEFIHNIKQKHFNLLINNNIDTNILIRFTSLARFNDISNINIDHITSFIYSMDYESNVISMYILGAI